MNSIHSFNVGCLGLFKFTFLWRHVVQSLSQIGLFATPWTASRQASPSFTVSQSLLRLMSIGSVMASNHLLFCHPLLLLVSIFPRIKVFSNEVALRIRWPKYWSLSIVLPVNIQGLFPLGSPGLLSLLFQGLSRVFSSTTIGILQCSAFFIVQLSHPCKHDY